MNKRSTIISLVAGLTGLYELVVASRVLTWVHVFLPATVHMAISLVLILFLVYMLRGKKGEVRKSEEKLAPFDLFFLGSGLIGAGYVVINYQEILSYSSYGYLDLKGMILAFLLIISLLETSRRLVGWILPLVITFFMITPLIQDYLPGLLHGKNLPVDSLTFGIYAGTSGIFGKPLGVAVNIIITFIIFGGLMQEAGAGKWFFDLAMSIAGWARGGIGKTAIVASGVFGMISGSPSANVATTGAFTIPMMIRMGYPAKLAGAVEAVASTGGQFMPPVMGAIAFIMAEWLGIPYSQIAFAAFVPALLYYIILFLSIHFESIKLGLKPSPAQELPPFCGTFVRGWYYILPLIGLIYLIAKSYPPEMAGIYSIIILIAISFLSPNKENRLIPRKIWNALIDGTKTWITPAAITATVGILISSLEISGLGVKFSSFLVDMTGGSLLATLIFVGFASFIMGMGMESIPTYMTLAIIAVPALIELGVSPLVAHLFVIYWGLSAFITPPVCLSVYIACGISGSKLWETGFEAVRLGIAVFIVPFAFVYNPALVMRGSIGEIIAAFCTALAGGFLVAAAMRGFWKEKLSLWARGAMFVGGLLLIGPTTAWTTLAGVGLGLLGIMENFFKPLFRRKESIWGVGK